MLGYYDGLQYWLVLISRALSSNVSLWCQKKSLTHQRQYETEVMKPMIIENVDELLYLMISSKFFFGKFFLIRKNFNSNLR